MSSGVWNDNTMKLMPNPGCLHFFKSKAPDENMRTNLFVYQHMETNKFMLAQWLGGDVFIPILEMGDEPLLDDEIVANYMAYCYPNSRQDLVQGLRDAKNNQRRLDEDFQQNNREERARDLRDNYGYKMPDQDGCAFLPPELVGNKQW